MSEPEPFLARWSRRKREVEKEPQDASGKPVPDSAAALAPTQPVEIAKAEQRISPKAEAPAFDPASLPPIEEIGMNTDIRGFLAQGVPTELKRAALRRVWAADPAIRDFVGLAENQWDFTKPDSIPGFGELPADFDVADMVRRVFGDPAPEGAPQDQVATTAQEYAEIPTEFEVDGGAPSEQSGRAQTPGEECHNIPQLPIAGESTAGEGDGEEMVHCASSAAVQTKVTLSHPDMPKIRRPHGGALPQVSPKINEDS